MEAVSPSNKVHPSLLLKKIIHIDMDAFYASVEIRDNPDLAGKPVVVGGSPQSRGVVCTASYEARKFGIRSAMACSQAHRLCPKAVFIRPNFSKYREVSEKIREIFSRYTKLIEPLSLDEAYLDVTGHELYAVKIASLIRQQVYEETKLTCSAGVAPNKMIAKIASDINKPNGITIVLPDQVLAFMENLPLRKINGIGPATEKRLQAEGFNLCKDIWPYTVYELHEKLGDRMGDWLHKRSRGIDDRAVSTSRKRKSLGTEDTFAKDIKDKATIQGEIKRIGESVAESLQSRSFVGKTVTLKVKYADFKQITRSLTLDYYTNSANDIILAANDLLEKTEAGQKPVRLLGISMSKLETKPENKPSEVVKLI